MNAHDLYPYWDGLNEEYREFVSMMTQDELSKRVAGTGPSVRELVARNASEERFLVGSVLLGNAVDLLNSGDYPDGLALSELLAKTRVMTNRALEPLTQAGLRSVRTLPADPAINQHESNVTVSWIVWKILQNEIEAFANVKLRWKDLGH